MSAYPLPRVPLSFLSIEGSLKAEEAARKAAEQATTKQMNTQRARTMAKEAEALQRKKAIRSAASQHGSNLAFAYQAQEAERQKKEDEAWKLMSAQEQRFRLDREAFEREQEKEAFDKREVEGKGVRANVVKKKAAAAEARRQAEKEATAALMLKTQEEQRQQAFTERHKRVEAEKNRKAYDDQVAEAEKLRLEAKALAEKMAKESFWQGEATKGSVKAMQDQMEEEESKEKYRLWKEQQEVHAAAEKAEADAAQAARVDFNTRPHGMHVHTACNDVGT